MDVLEKDEDLKFPNIHIIQASAGSGKTHTLVLRYLQYILSDKIPKNDISNILAITFTNNAAIEMKQKILKRLKQVALSGEDKELLEILNLNAKSLQKKAKNLLENILEKYSDFHIQTIDSFMKRVLNSCAVEIGFPPEIEITTSYSRLIEYTSATILKNLIESKESKIKKDFEEFLSYPSQIAGESFDWDPTLKINQVFEKFLEKESKTLENIVLEGTHPCTPSRVKHRTGFDRGEKTYPPFASIFERISEKLEFIEKISPQGMKALDEYKKAAETKDCQFFIKRVFSDRTVPFKTKDHPNYEQIKLKWLQINDDIKEIVESTSVSKYLPYLRLYSDFKSELLSVKSKIGMVHISDINKLLSEYIKTRTVPQIYFGLGDVLYHFMIDEFQDTDIVQWNNIKPLIEEALSKAGTFFAVGDLKQAIYMFRNADYKIMLGLIDTINKKSDEYKDIINISRTSKVTDLETNFRSGSVIVEYVDNLFKNKMKPCIGDDRTHLTSYIQHPLKEKMGRGYVHRDTVIEDKDNKPEKEVLLRIIRNVTLRYGYRDIAILSNTNKDVERVLEWLQNEKIPSCSYSSLDIRKRKIIMEITELLKFLDKPTDNLAFSIFLLSDVFINEITKNEHPEYTRDNILKFLFYSRTNPEYLYVQFRDRFGNLWEKYFENLFKNVGLYPVYELVWLMFRTFNVLENFNGETAFLITYLEAINIIEERGANSMDEFLKVIQGDNAEDSVLNIALPDYLDATRIMTFHKSKGLDFPVVINLIYSTTHLSDSMYFNKTDDGIRLYHITKKATEKSLFLKTIYQEQKNEEDIQRLNLLYVATTRAKDEMYTIVVKKENEKDTFICFL